jgi:hypothetical protein
MGKVDTGNVTGRRKLHFDGLADLDAEAEGLAAADRAGRLTKLGNWSLGQALNHLATWTNYGFDGYPMKVPLAIKLILRPMKGRFLKGPIPAGRDIPKVQGGTFGIEPTSTADGLKNLKAANARLKSSPPTKANPVFGAMSHEEWIALMLRHAELHLSFFRMGEVVK